MAQDREILFRARGGYYSMGGSPPDEGKWIEWNPLKKEFPRPWMEYPCQFTGIEDINKQKIFEGDICKAKYADDNNGGSEFFYLVQIPQIWLDTTFSYSYCRVQSDMEVVGNVYDNPELLDI